MRPPSGGNVQFEQSERALDLMRCARPDQRRCSRVQLTSQATATFSEKGSETQIAFVRDISVIGVFFFCKTRPHVGQTVSLRITLGENGSNMSEVCCEGVVVRVEDHPLQEAAIGIAVQFKRYELVNPAQQQHSEHSVSFVGWSLEMVEKLFHRRTELETYASRIQGAA
jgi:hypothetical protein